MRVHTSTTWELADDGSLHVVADSWYEYSGPVAECKKGRKAQEKIIEQSMQQSAEDRAAAAAEKAKAEPFVQSLESTKPGELSKLSQAQYASDLENIARTYGDIREAGLRTLGARGFGRAPSGFTTSMLNSANESQGRDETNAYRQGLGRTYEQGLQALNYRTGQQGLFSGRSGQETEQASTAAARRAQMGSTFGDITGGIADVAGIATGGLSSLGSRLTPQGQLPLTRSTYPQPLMRYSPSGIGYF